MLWSISVHHAVAVPLWKFLGLFKSGIHLEDRLLPPLVDVTVKFLKFLFLFFFFLTQGDIRVSGGKIWPFIPQFFLVSDTSELCSYFVLEITVN